MRSPDIQKISVVNIKRTPHASAKAELIINTGGEKMTALTTQAKPAITIGREEIVLSSFAIRKVKENRIEANNTEVRFTTTCCNNDYTRGDGSCPPTACTNKINC